MHAIPSRRRGRKREMQRLIAGKRTKKTTPNAVRTIVTPDRAAAMSRGMSDRVQRLQTESRNLTNDMRMPADVTQHARIVFTLKNRTNNAASCVLDDDLVQTT